MRFCYSGIGQGSKTATPLHLLGFASSLLSGVPRWFIAAFAAAIVWLAVWELAAWAIWKKKASHR